MKKIINPWVGVENYDCFGCSPDNPIGLHMEFYEDGDEIVSFWHPHEHQEGWIGVIHGGILATLIDETCGWTVFRKCQTSGMTTSLQLRYKKPVKGDEKQITLRAHITEQKRGIVFIDCNLENSAGEVCVEGHATYYAFPEEQAKEMGFTHCDVEPEQLLSM
jgi:uncharacterized protein (TIGR00369 family)